MEKLELPNKVSPCCKKGITGFNINSKYLGEIEIYRCSYCGGEFTKTEILRANVESDKSSKDEENKIIKVLESRISFLESQFVKKENEKENTPSLLDLSEKIDWIYTELLRKKYEIERNEDR